MGASPLKILEDWHPPQSLKRPSWLSPTWAFLFAREGDVVEHPIDRLVLDRIHPRLRHDPGLRPGARLEREDHDLRLARQPARFGNLAVKRGAPDDPAARNCHARGL